MRDKNISFGRSKPNETVGLYSPTDVAITHIVMATHNLVGTGLRTVRFIFILYYIFNNIYNILEINRKICYTVRCINSNLKKGDFDEFS